MKKYFTVGGVMGGMVFVFFGLGLMALGLPFSGAFVVLLGLVLTLLAVTV